MKAKNAMYAAVGAPIVAARALNARLEHLREEMETRGEGLSDRAQQMLDDWSREGRQAMEKVSDGQVVDDFTSKVDFDQAREQVGKLREQLEEMLSTWKTSFRAETGDRAPATPDPAAKAERAHTEKAEGAPAAMAEAPAEQFAPVGEAAADPQEEWHIPAEPPPVETDAAEESSTTESSDEGDEEG